MIQVEKPRAPSSVALLAREIGGTVCSSHARIFEQRPAAMCSTNVPTKSTRFMDLSDHETIFLSRAVCLHAGFSTLFNSLYGVNVHLARINIKPMPKQLKDCKIDKDASCVDAVL